jgi:septal ring factor EnvC (AmiA/AmiB activator)
MNEEKHEGSSWFWKLFGPAIIGVVSILLITVFNHLNSNISALRSDMLGMTAELRNEISKLNTGEILSLREKVVTLQQQTQSIEKNIISLDAENKRLRENITASDKVTESQKEQLERIRERIGEIIKNSEAESKRFIEAIQRLEKLISETKK